MGQLRTEQAGGRKRRSESGQAGVPQKEYMVAAVVSWQIASLMLMMTTTAAVPLAPSHETTPGWRLEQRSLVVLKWRTPGGRTYTTTPAVYAC